MLAVVCLGVNCAAPLHAQSVSVSSSDTLAGLSRKWVEAYQAKHPEPKLEITTAPTAAAITALAGKKADLLLVPRALRYPEMQAAEAGLGGRPAERKVGVYGVVVYVNAASPVKTLTYDELFGVYRGKITNWKELGGPDALIAVLTPETNSVAAELFLEEVLNRKGLGPSVRTVPAAELLKAVSQDQNAIGYAALAQVEGARALAIKRAFSSTPAEATAETIAERTYPIARYLYGYSAPAANAAAKGLLDWLLSPDAQALLPAAGFYPLPERLRSNP